MNTETKTKNKRYDEAFKRSTVEHWVVSGKPAMPQQCRNSL